MTGVIWQRLILRDTYFSEIQTNLKSIDNNVF